MNPTIHFNTLIFSYLILLIFCLMMASVIYKSQKTKISLYSILYWVSIIIGFVAHGMVGNHPILATAAIGLVYLNCWTVSLILSELFGTKSIGLNSILIYLGSCAVGFILYLQDFGFSVYCAPVAFMTGGMFIFISIKAYLFQREKGISAVSLMLLVAVGLSGLHVLDYPFMRLEPEAFGIGFAIAFFNGLMMAILVPMTVNEKFHKDYQLHLQHDIEVATATLRQRNISLEEARDENTNLVRVLVHDMSNAMAVTRGMLFICKRALVSKAVDQTTISDIVEKLGRAEAATEMQQALIDNVKTLQKMSIAGAPVPLKPISLRDGIDKSLNLHLERINAKRLKIIKKNFIDSHIMANEVILINCILNNLLTNAIKFSFFGGEITIEIEDTQDKVLLKFKDRGVGISQAKINEINSGNYTDSSEGTEGEKGTGFGMSIVLCTIKKFDGKMFIQSRDASTFPDDHGTEITLSFNKYQKPQSEDLTPSAEFS